tara:strand:+ start:1845 stop:3056 length:1212 start_codon:yes stop_codon:yes gene_type:complete
MKTKLLFALLCISALGYAQTFDNIPTGSGYYINKLIPSPSGPDLTNEYIEIRGTANTTVPTDLYLISIEGDGDSSSLGQVEEAIQLGDGTRTFGSNGILVVVANYTETDNGNTVTMSPYLSIISSGATIITIELTGTDVNSSSSSAVDTKTPDIGYDGNLIDASGNYMLISASSNPKDVYIDGTGTGDANGIIDASGDHTSWTLYDSVAYLDDNDEGSGEYGYTQIVYAQQNGLLSGVQFVTTSATVVNFDTTSDANYILRQGTKTGYTADDWIVSANGSSSNVPNWIFSTSSEKVYPNAFEGWGGIKDVYGQLNPTAESLSVDDVLSPNFKIYPNPAKDYIQIASKDVQISSIEMYNLIGKKLISEKNLVNNRLNISSLSSGMYLLKINSDVNSITKKIIVE